VLQCSGSGGGQLLRVPEAGLAAGSDQTEQLRETGNKMDETVAVADRPAEGIERRRLIQVLSDLSNEGCTEAPAQQAETLASNSRLDQDEQLVTELRAGLARLAGLRPGEPVEPLALQGALEGAEFVVRSDILSGQSARLPQRLPSFVFLVLLPLLGKAEALRAADRAARLLDRT
jgi:hypothetical protein